MSLTKLVRLRKKGQITIPREMRHALKLEEGEALIVALNGDALLVTRYAGAGRSAGSTFIKDARALVVRMVAEQGGEYLPAGSISDTLSELREPDDE